MKAHLPILDKIHYYLSEHLLKKSIIVKNSEDLFPIMTKENKEGQSFVGTITYIVR